MFLYYSQATKLAKAADARRQPTHCNAPAGYALGIAFDIRIAQFNGLLAEPVNGFGFLSLYTGTVGYD